MNKQDVLDGFASLSPEEQEAVREELGFDPLALCKSMMQEMQGGAGPMSVCKDMMQKRRAKSRRSHD